LPSKNRLTTPTDSCGIHFLSTNSDRTLIATGARNPSDIAIFNASSLFFSSNIVLEGHSDWCFSAEFISSDLLISGGRDGDVKLWNVSNESNQFIVKKPLLTRREHLRKVRDLKFNNNLKIFGTVSADNYVKHWDTSNLDVVTSTYIDASELVCMAVDLEHNLTAVGTQNYTALIDGRLGSIVETIPAKDTWGIRSLSFNDRVMGIGGGLGQLHFYDLRFKSYIILNDQKEFISSGTGWLLKDEIFYNHFYGLDVSNAIYTHNWSPSRLKLFVGGGPLLLGLKGNYGSVWI